MTQPSQGDYLAKIWPATYAALRQTFFRNPDFGKTDDTGNNDAGYLLAGLARYERTVNDKHAQRNITRAAMDLAAARETRYQFDRGRQFRRAAAALSTCFVALAIERPEKLFAALAREAKCKKT